jgi:hypothetical protein
MLNPMKYKIKMQVSLYSSVLINQAWDVHSLYAQCRSHGVIYFIITLLSSQWMLLINLFPEFLSRSPKKPWLGIYFRLRKLKVSYHVALVHKDREREVCLTISSPVTNSRATQIYVKPWTENEHGFASELCL